MDGGAEIIEIITRKQLENYSVVSEKYVAVRRFMDNDYGVCMEHVEEHKQ